MVKIGVSDQFSNQPKPNTFPGQLRTYVVAEDGNSLNDSNNYIQTDVVGQGYPNATPIVVPPDSSSGAVVNMSPNPFQGIQPRRNTPDNPSEQAGIVNISLTSGVLKPVIQYTPPEVEP